VTEHINVDTDELARELLRLTSETLDAVAETSDAAADEPGDVDDQRLVAARQRIAEVLDRVEEWPRAVGRHLAEALLDSVRAVAVATHDDLHAAADTVRSVGESPLWPERTRYVRRFHRTGDGDWTVDVDPDAVAGDS
jgi:hypothetical protein